MRILLPLVLLLVSIPVGAGEMYKWVDEDGTVHFSDRRQSDEAEAVRVEPLNVADPADLEVSDESPDTSRDAAGGGRVTMYSTSWCGYCKQARRYFTEQGIPFREHDIEASERARREYDRLGGGGVPLIKVGERTMNGFSVGSFERFYRR